jgi:hypothetical protein
MDELDLFRDFRRGVAAPSDDARKLASTRVARAVDDGDRPRIRALAPVQKRSGYGALAVFALAGATATGLFLSTPWSSSPGFLERAEAALATPDDTILHMKWEVTSSVTDPRCSVTRGPNEMWIDQQPPHAYRAILEDPPPAGSEPLSLACSSAKRREVGGIVDPACSPAEQADCTTLDTLEFEPPATLRESTLQFVLPPDPVAMLREAIRSGNVHHEGNTELNGRTVERLRIDGPIISEDGVFSSSACAFPSCAFGDAFVDPDTFYPVEMHAPPLLVMPAPDSGVVVRSPDGVPLPGGGNIDRPLAEINVVDRYLKFEYLPRTEANLALTDMRAQHPDASVVDWTIPMND